MPAEFPVRRLLITGGSGVVGQVAVQALVERGHRVRAFDRVAGSGAHEQVIGDLTDADALLMAARDIDCVIHLAAFPDEADFLTTLLPSNVIGLHNVLEAARKGGVQRVILASSGQVNWDQLHEGPWPVRVDDPVQPRAWYALTKILAEQAGYVYWKRHGMDMLVVRLGTVVRSAAHAREVLEHEVSPDVYLARSDAADFFIRAVEFAPGFGFKIVFASSKPVIRERYDSEPARKLLGFDPRCRWPQGVEHFLQES